jgi:hypothetical protein
MAELTVDDVRKFSARLDEFDDDPLQDMLDAALAAARRYCGWSVTPVATDDELVIDGPGGRVLSLPTLNLIEVTAVTECGVVLDVTKLDVSRRKGTVEKQSWYGCWSHRDGAISVTITHGFTETEAADWRRAVLRLVDIMSLEPVMVGAERDSPEMKRKRVDDVDYEWYDKLITTNDQLAALFSQYRILPSP